MKIFTYFNTETDLPPDWKVSQNPEKIGGFQFYTQNYSNNFTLSIFPGDCGTLLLRNAGAATRESLQLAKKVASMCGYDTIIGTVVELGTNVKQRAIEAYRKERWIKALEGKSNRKHNYAHNRKLVYILHLRNCKHKGY